MEKKNQTRASQTSKSDSTKVETRAKEVKVKEQPKVWTPIVLRYAQRAKWLQTQMGQGRNPGICRHEKHTRTLKIRV